MKKLITVILIMAMLLPAAAMAADPIIGNWYFLYDKSEYPEIASMFGNADVSFSVYRFMESGTIMSTELSVTGDTGTADYVAAGRWVKEDYGYKYSIIGIGEGKALVEGDNMFFATQGMEGVYMLLRRMVPFNPYSDYVRK